MACNDCVSDVFMKKIGRCRTCMWQLLVLATVCWLVWFYLYRDSPLEVNSIALLFFGISFSALLVLHWIVWVYRALTGHK